MSVDLTSINEDLKELPKYEDTVFSVCNWTKDNGFNLPWYDDANERKGVMFIGQDFGNMDSAKAQYEERLKDSRFVPNCGGGEKHSDRSYRRLFDAVINPLKKVGIPVYCANSSYYLRPENEEEATKDPNDTHWKLSKEILRKEITLIDPELIVTLGSEVSDRLDKIYSIQEYWKDIPKPSIVTTPLAPCSVIVSYHPSASEFSFEYVQKLLELIHANVKQPTAVG